MRWDAPEKKISANVVMFCRHLRGYGFVVGPTAVGDCLLALTMVNMTSPAVFRAVLRAVLVRSAVEHELFDDRFDQFWRGIRRPRPMFRCSRPVPSWRYGLAGSRPLSERLIHSGDQKTVRSTVDYSARHVVTHKDFNDYRDDELDAVAAEVRRIACTLSNRSERRFRASPLGRTFDCRRTLREAFRTGGEWLHIRHKIPRRRRVRLVLLCDVSRSMERYSGFFIQFLHAFQTRYYRVETFVFSSVLRRVTMMFARQSFVDCLRALAGHVEHWAGGTRIGHALADFVESHSRTMVDRRTVVLIVSDGWDSDASSLVADSMRAIHRRAGCVIWLNPHAADAGFSPTCNGMRAAIPHIDVLAGVGDLASLRRFGTRLRRRQYPRCRGK